MHKSFNSPTARATRDMHYTLHAIAPPAPTLAATGAYAFAATLAGIIALRHNSPIALADGHAIEHADSDSGAVSLLCTSYLSRDTAQHKPPRYRVTIERIE